MNGVIGMTNLALEECQSPEQRGHLELVSQSADHLLSLLNDILDFSKIESGKLFLEDIEFDLLELIDKMVLTMSPSAMQKGVKLIAKVDPKLPRYFRSDPTRLKQVLLNLVCNAVKFTAVGTVELAAVWKGADGQVFFSVSDTGIGIAKDRQRSIFESFVQADGGTARKFGGTGLGLAISDRLVQLMGGRIELQSEPEVGSTFSFSIPLRRAAGDEAVSTAPGDRADSNIPGAVSPRGLRILVAEDNPVNQRLAAAVLRKAGHVVTLANNGREAVAACAKSEFDMVLMDVQMPDMDGLAAASAIREAEQGRTHIPIMALTAHAMQGDRELCLSAGMDDYLTKPIDVKQLMIKIAALSANADHARESLV